MDSKSLSHTRWKCQKDIHLGELKDLSSELRGINQRPKKRRQYSGRSVTTSRNRWITFT